MRDSWRDKNLELIIQLFNNNKINKIISEGTRTNMRVFPQLFSSSSRLRNKLIWAKKLKEETHFVFDRR